MPRVTNPKEIKHLVCLNIEMQIASRALKIDRKNSFDSLKQLFREMWKYQGIEYLNFWGVPADPKEVGWQRDLSTCLHRYEYATPYTYGFLCSEKMWHYCQYYGRFFYFCHRTCFLGYFSHLLEHSNCRIFWQVNAWHLTTRPKRWPYFWSGVHNEKFILYQYVINQDEAIEELQIEN